ncbi:hypothetical protein GCM10009818_16310 [Nakamurella flavida]
MLSKAKEFGDGDGRPDGDTPSGFFSPHDDPFADHHACRSRQMGPFAFDAWAWSHPVCRTDVTQVTYPDPVRRQPAGDP